MQLVIAGNIIYNERKEMMKSTTIISVRHNNEVAMAGDGQVTIGDAKIKHGAKKIRKLYNNTVLVGFAGSAADAITLYSKFENKLQEYRGNLQRAAVELAKDWRTDKILRRLEALLIVSDKEYSYLISGTGDLIEPDEGILAIGSGGSYALAAAKALIKFTNMRAADIALESLKIASSICIYTNENITVETL